MTTGAGRPCTHLTRAGKSCPNLRPCPEHPPRDPSGSRDRNASWSRNRNTTQQGHFRKATLRRDNFTCQRCGHYDHTGRTLDAHHVTPDSGVTLCNPCHVEVDPKARRRNTKPQG